MLHRNLVYGVLLPRDHLSELVRVRTVSGVFLHETRIWIDVRRLRNTSETHVFSFHLGTAISTIFYVPGPPELLFFFHFLRMLCA